MVRVPLFKDVFGTEAGEIVIDGENIRVKWRTSNLNVPLGYLEDVAIADRTHLGKINARITVYDVLGNRNVIEAIMSEPNFFTLRGFLKRK